MQVNPAVEGRRICAVDGCSGSLHSDNSSGFCRFHRAAKNRHAPRFCAVESCGQTLHAKNKTGFCPIHYAGHAPNPVQRDAERRAEAEDRRSQWRLCAGDGCTRRVRPDNKSGRCWDHRYVPVSVAERGQCSIEGCGRRLSKQNTVGRCQEHIDPRWVAAVCAADGCTKTLNVNNLTGFCGQHANGYDRDARLQRDYGISEADHSAMLAAQNGVCALCGNPPQEGGKRAASRLHVDHNHKTKQVRQMLCLNCNHGLGKFRENPELLRKAADYLEFHAMLAAQSASEDAALLF